MIVLAARFFYQYKFLVCVAIFLVSFSSCTIVKNYPPQPFVFETEVKVDAPLSTDERNELIGQLENQFHDSIRVRTVQKIIGWEKDKGPALFYSVMDKPPVYDSINADKSVVFMRGLLHSIGYYRDTISYTTEIKKVQDQQRVKVAFNVVPGKQFRIDSIAYNFNDSLGYTSQATRDTLQKITDQAIDGALIRKDGPYAIPLISAEFDRLSDVYRNNGYLLFSREELIGVWDTVGLALLDPTLDPLAQLEILRRRQENPTATIEIRLRTNPDTSHLRRFHVGNITIYPDLTVDSNRLTRRIRQQGDLTVISYQNLFKPKILAENVYLQKGRLYRQSDYLRTLNRFNSLGSWRLVTIDQLPRPNEDTVDFILKLTPTIKYLYRSEIESSQNWGSVLTQGNLVGVNLSIQNRNFGKAANQANTSLRFGTEVSSSSTGNTTQASFSHNIIFPRVIPKHWFLKNWENARTSLSVNTNYVNRVDFLELLSINGSWGYEATHRNILISFRFPNIEYAFLERGQFLRELIDSNRSYEFIFNDGLVASATGGVSISGGNQKITRILRLNTEWSGMFGLLRAIPAEKKLYRFMKFDADFRQTHSLHRNAFAWRLFGGLGVGLPFNSIDSNNERLPFFKSYFAGGANSMRAWPLRKLGPGSAIESFDKRKVPDRFGDIQLEMNAEYRIYLATIKGVAINTALFADMGNIWYLRNTFSYADDSEIFKFNKLWKDIAIGAGTGVRVDFGLFLVRLDYGLKMKDPSPADPAFQNVFFPERNLLKGQLQLGVTYPF